ncbi:MAG: GNAT family N-acetyltransferase [Kofleriaceae bacterium]|nr:GNAT family N-acetyltransferase [Kofleriaceae bacterium]MCB9574592.1 GNAT family N-acetyltransferase [Kofleriaceae bacterium]
MTSRARATVVLRPMTDDELAAYVPWAIDNLAAEVARARGVTAAQARALAQSRVDAVLPGGRPRPGEAFPLAIVDGAGPTARRHGTILAGLDRSLGPVRLYLYDLVIDAPARRRGLGRAAMVALEAFAAARGVHTIALNVFGHNAVAEALYRSLGYVAEHTAMAKRLGAP